tara:strand:+ start:18274 stop:18801 length:528 start_codon:yes stop_codon:yes gene_type:complete
VKETVMDEQVPWVQQQADPLAPRDDDLRHAMELLFFAYRDFTGEADAVLADYDMGRAHHRALYFIGANTGISVSELLAILKITKQSLNRVLSTLIDEGYVVQETDDGDRRRRLMHLTPKGRDLEQLLTRRQSAHIARAYRDAGPDAVEGFRRVLFGLINEADRHRVPPPGPAAHG